MVLWAAVLLSIAVAGGLLLATGHLRRARVPFAVGLGHAVVAIAGLVLLAAAVWSQPQALTVNAGLLFFALAAIGGLFILLFRLQGERPPGFMIALHGVVAGTGLALVWFGILSAG